VKEVKMLEFGAKEVYYLGGASRISKARRYWVKKVLNDPTQKHHLIVGVFDQRDAHRIGEFIAVVRPENSKKTYFQTWDAFSLARAGRESAKSIQAQRDVLEGLRLGNGMTVQGLTRNWSSIRNNTAAIEYFSQLMRGYSIKLLSADTASRISAGQKLTQAIDLKDSKGRYNPGAVSAKLVSAESDLVDQLVFDSLSLGSAQSRSGFAGIVAKTFDQELVWLDRLLRFGKNTTVKTQLRRSAVLYSCKPFGYGMRSIAKNGYIDGIAAVAARKKIRSVFFTESLLGEFSNSLSLAKNEDIRQMRPGIVDDLISTIDVPAPNQAYAGLLAQLGSGLEELGEIIASDASNKLVVKKITQIKKHLRYRDANPQGWPA
jgi:hypothetical protein